jgi:hypothetical protein
MNGAMAVIRVLRMIRIWKNRVVEYQVVRTWKMRTIENEGLTSQSNRHIRSMASY